MLFYIPLWLKKIYLQKLHSPPRNLRAGNKSPALFLKKPLRRPIIDHTQNIHWKAWIYVTHVTKFLSNIAPSQAPSLNYLKTCFLFQYNQYYDRVKLLFLGFFTNAKNFLFKQCHTRNHFKVTCVTFSFRRVYIHFSLLYAFC